MARKFTQTELGKLAGLSRQAVAEIEGNTGRVSNFLALEKHIPISVTGLPMGARRIGERLRLARISKSLSLRAAAERAEIAVNTVREIEAGRGTLGPLHRLASVLAPAARARAVSEGHNRRGIAVVGWSSERVRRRADHYVTPAPIVRLLLDHEVIDRAHPVLEPAVGEARIIERVLLERGYQVVCSDLHGRGDECRDFFDIHQQHHTVITNPPFRLHQEFIKHAKRIVANKFCFLLPLNYLVGAQRHSDIWSDPGFPLARVHVLTRGIDFVGTDPFADRFKPAQIYCGWFIFERQHRGPPTLHWMDSNPYVERIARTPVR
ncbi:helix-turn-helix transcriptional regulator [Sphingomonas kaistensis]|uniref:Helix-turn-helix transcriptional regulator n=1 Tax=Sphingomonas kaistensis TaxID=298708 RepID=A0ABZ2G3V6_9SPHN